MSGKQDQPDQIISRKFEEDSPVISVEFYPPKGENGAEQILKAARELTEISPDFVSITYGAGGTTRERTIQYATLLKKEAGFDVMPHLTCVGHSRKELSIVLEAFHNAGFRNIMALRGDPPKGETAFKPHPDGLGYASELVAFIRENYPDFCLGVAGYPEKHPEAANFESDLKNLKIKVDAGANFITTQLFFNNDDYFNFVDACRNIGITIPIIAGLLPVISAGQISRFCAMCGAAIPEELQAKVNDAGDDDNRVVEIGIDWVTQQISELIEKGAPGVHLYIMNRSYSVLEAIKRLRKNGVL